MQSKESSSSETSDINSPEKKKRRSKIKPIRLLASDDETGNERRIQETEEHREGINDESANITDQTSVQYTDLCAADDVSPD